MLSLSTGDYRVVLEGGMKARYVDTGHLVYARGGDLLSVPFDLDALEVTGPLEAVIEDVSMDIDNGSAEFAISEKRDARLRPRGYAYRQPLVVVGGSHRCSGASSG